MIGLQSSLNRILSHLQNSPTAYPLAPLSAGTFGPPSSTTPRFTSSTALGRGLSPEAAYYPTAPVEVPSGQHASSAGAGPSSSGDRGPIGSEARRKFPPLVPPPHKYATHGIVTSTASSSDDETEDILPRTTLKVPMEALQGLANAAAEAAVSVAEPNSSSP